MSTRTVYVPVSAEIADEVSAFADRLEAVGATLDGPAGPTGQSVDAQPGRARNNGGGTVWRPEQYVLFRHAAQESYRRVRAFVDVLASQPGESLPTSEVTALSGVTDTQIRAALGKFTMWIGANLDTAVWPFGWAFGPEVDPANPREFHYTMTAEQADAWRAGMAAG